MLEGVQVPAGEPAPHLRLCTDSLSEAVSALSQKGKCDGLVRPAAVCDCHHTMRGAAWPCFSSSHQEIASVLILCFAIHFLHAKLPERRHPGMGDEDLGFSGTVPRL